MTQAQDRWGRAKPGARLGRRENGRAGHTEAGEGPTGGFPAEGRRWLSWGTGLKQPRVGRGGRRAAPLRSSRQRSRAIAPLRRGPAPPPQLAPSPWRLQVGGGERNEAQLLFEGAELGRD